MVQLNLTIDELYLKIINIGSAIFGKSPVGNGEVSVWSVQEEGKVCVSNDGKTVLIEIYDSLDFIYEILHAV